MENIMTKSQFIDNLETTMLYSGISLYPTTESGKEKIEFAKIIMEELKRKGTMTVDDLQMSNKKLNECSLQKISAILKSLVDNGNVKKEMMYKKSYFSINSNNENTNDLSILIDFLGNYYVENSNEIINKANDIYEKKEQFNCHKISLEKENLLKYLNTLIEVSSDIYSLQQRYDILRNLMLEKIEKNVSDFVKINSDILKEKEDILKEIEILNNISKPIYIKEIELPLPDKKQEPILKITKPVEPQYLVPNFFNKKKVIIENERLKNEYNQNMEKYNIEYEKYTKELNEYNTYLVDYNKEIEEIKNKEQILNDENYNKKLKAYEVLKEKNETIINEKKEKLKDFENNYISKFDEKLLEYENYKDIKKIKYELDYVNMVLEKDIELENKLYSYEIIYGKYRNFVAITSFYDYLMSSRCDQLEGANGAYNLFEQETRSNIIVEKLDKIISSLEDIKSMQYCIYNQMKIINKSLDLINSQLLVNNLLQAVQISQLNEIIDNTQEIAYNSKVSAYYSQKIANYTKALTILTFLK